MSKALDKKREREKKKSPSDRTKKQVLLGMPLSKENYLFTGIGCAVIILGYVLIAVEKSVDGFLSLNVSPLLIIGGFFWIIYAILYKPNPTDGNTNAAQQ
jgi:hypothetical protein